MNGDGKLDILTADYNAANLSVFLGNGNGTFVSRVTYYSDQSAGLVAFDANGDGKLDIVMTNYAAKSNSILLGNGNGTFQARTTVAAAAGSSGSWSIASGDLNGDGIIDFVSSDYGSNGASIFIGNGNGTFKARTTAFGNTNSLFVQLADVNGDSKLDLLIADQNRIISVWIGNGNGTFNSRVTYNGGNQRIQVADVNGDGKVDIIAGDFSKLLVNFGNGNGSFNAAVTFATGGYPMAANVVDLNGDGVLDILTGDRDGKATILIGNGANMGSSGLYLNTQADATNALSVLDSALAYINSARASIGALQSRLDFATSVNMNTIENISAARSQIMDTDMAAETAEFARLQILQRAGIAVLGQANLNSNLSLKLLENL